MFRMKKVNLELRLLIWRPNTVEISNIYGMQLKFLPGLGVVAVACVACEYPLFC